MLHFLSVCMYCLPKGCFIELVEENTLCFYTVGDILANDLRFYDDVKINKINGGPKSSYSDSVEGKLTPLVSGLKNRFLSFIFAYDFSNAEFTF